MVAEATEEDGVSDGLGTGRESNMISGLSNWVVEGGAIY